MSMFIARTRSGMGFGQDHPAIVTRQSTQGSSTTWPGGSDARTCSSASSETSTPGSSWPAAGTAHPSAAAAATAAVIALGLLFPFPISVVSPDRLIAPSWLVTCDAAPA